MKLVRTKAWLARQPPPADWRMVQELPDRMVFEAGSNQAAKANAEAIQRHMRPQRKCKGCGEGRGFAGV